MLTCMPASSIAHSVSTSRHAGPSVATSLVLGGTQDVSLSRSDETSCGALKNSAAIALSRVCVCVCVDATRLPYRGPRAKNGVLRG
jgi:hypothetical protein